MGGDLEEERLLEGSGAGGSGVGGAEETEDLVDAHGVDDG